MALAQLLDRGALLNPDGPCLTQGEQNWSYRDVQLLSYRIGRRLQFLGLGPCDKASVLSRNEARAFMCLFGFARAGLAWVPANPKMTVDDNHHLLEFLDCRLVIFHSEFVGMVAELRRRLPHLAHWICLDRSLPDAPSLDEWLGDVPDARVDAPSNPDTLAVVMPTGGTTGRSKGVQLTQRNVMAFVASHLACLGYPQNQRPVNLIAAPLTHAAGFAAFPTIARGGHIVILAGPDPAQMLQAIERYRITELFLPPTVIYRLLNFPGIASHDFSSLRYFIYAAAPMSVEKLKQALRVFGPCMTQVFGQSEAPMMCTCLAPEEHYVDGAVAPDEVLSSCGHPTPLIELKILDDDRLQVAPGTRGEICVRGDLVTTGYYKQPDVTAATIVDGWLHTGDIGFQDAAGRIHICDRKKDMIISGGFNIYPQEIEQLIWTHAAVEDCAVIGVPDDEWGEAVKAVVELKAGAKVDPAELIALCKQQLGSLKTPKSVDVTDRLPRSPNGKVLKRKLRESYWADHGRLL